MEEALPWAWCSGGGLHEAKRNESRRSGASPKARLLEWRNTLKGGQQAIVRQRARDWRGLVRSATEHRSDSEAPESPTAGGYETPLPYRHAAAAAGGRAQRNKNSELNLLFVSLQNSPYCISIRSNICHTFH